MQPVARRSLLLLLAAIMLASPFGCTPPNQVAIQLRKDIEALKGQNAALQRQRQADAATIQSLQQQHGSLPTLPMERLDQLFTTHGFKLTNSTRVDDGQVKVYVVPLDGDGQKLKAAGTFVVQAYDLQNPKDPLVGQWNFDLAQARDSWNGELFEYNYVLRCPLAKTLTHNQLTVRVEFTDELTQRKFVEQKLIPAPIGAGPASAPTTAPQAGQIYPLSRYSGGGLGRGLSQRCVFLTQPPPPPSPGVPGEGER